MFYNNLLQYSRLFMVNINYQRGENIMNEELVKKIEVRLNQDRINREIEQKRISQEYKLTWDKKVKMIEPILGFFDNLPNGRFKIRIRNMTIYLKCGDLKMFNADFINIIKRPGYCNVTVTFSKEDSEFSNMVLNPFMEEKQIQAIANSLEWIEKELEKNYT